MPSPAMTCPFLFPSRYTHSNVLESSLVYPSLVYFEHGSLLPFLQFGQRFFSSVPRKALAMCNPQPCHVAFPQLEQSTLKHMMNDDECMSGGVDDCLIDECE
eukprot:743892_1